jgi:hypothetical protein
MPRAGFEMRCCSRQGSLHGARAADFHTQRETRGAGSAVWCIVVCGGAALLATHAGGDGGETRRREPEGEVSKSSTIRQSTPCFRAQGSKRLDLGSVADWEGLIRAGLDVT